MVNMETGLPLFCIPVVMEREGRMYNNRLHLVFFLFTQGYKLQLEFSSFLNWQSQIGSEQEALFYED